MNRKNVQRMAAVFAMTAALTGTAAAGKLTISGSTTVLPIVQMAAETYMDMHDDADISVRGGGSGVGIAALLDGRVDVANASREIKTKEITQARSKGIDPYENAIASDGLAVAVHPSNTVGAMDIATLKKIYTGEITNWKKLGGPDREIVIVSRDVSSGTYEVFSELVLHGAKVQDGALMTASNQAAATTIAQTPGAVGYVGLGYLSKGVKPLKVEGVAPSNATVQDGSYKLARKLYMYTNGKPKGAAKGFIDFILSSDGQKIVEQIGFVPVK